MNHRASHDSSIMNNSNQSSRKLGNGKAFQINRIENRTKDPTSNFQLQELNQGKVFKFSQHQAPRTAQNASLSSGPIDLRLLKNDSSQVNQYNQPS